MPKAEEQKKLYKPIFLAFALLVGAWLIGQTINVLMLGFASVLLAILLHSIGKWAKKVTRLPLPIALLASLIVILGSLSFIFWLYTPLIVGQFERLVNQLPMAIENVRNITFLNSQFLTDKTRNFLLNNEKIFDQLTLFFSVTIGSFVGFVIFILLGLYFAVDPERYVKSFLLFFPKEKQKKVEEVLTTVGQSLHWWLSGKVISMVSVGILTCVGLLSLKISLAFILGLLAGMLAFIPYVGAILASIPAILIALGESPRMAIYVTLLYLLIHFVDGYFITPYIEQRTVSIPPALTIFMQIIFTLLIGAWGLALATPLMVVVFSLLAQHYNSRKPVY